MLNNSKYLPQTYAHIWRLVIIIIIENFQILFGINYFEKIERKET